MSITTRTRKTASASLGILALGGLSLGLALPASAVPASEHEPSLLANLAAGTCWTGKGGNSTELDIRLVKTDAESGEHLAGATFRINGEHTPGDGFRSIGSDIAFGWSVHRNAEVTGLEEAYFAASKDATDARIALRETEAAWNAEHAAELSAVQDALAAAQSAWYAADQELANASRTFDDATAAYVALVDELNALQARADDLTSEEQARFNELPVLISDAESAQTDAETKLAAASDLEGETRTARDAAQGDMDALLAQRAEAVADAQAKKDAAEATEAATLQAVRDYNAADASLLSTSATTGANGRADVDLRVCSPTGTTTLTVTEVSAPGGYAQLVSPVTVTLAEGHATDDSELADATLDGNVLTITVKNEKAPETPVEPEKPEEPVGPEEPQEPVKPEPQEPKATPLASTGGDIAGAGFAAAGAALLAAAGVGILAFSRGKVAAG